MPIDYIDLNLTFVPKCLVKWSKKCHVYIILNFTKRKIFNFLNVKGAGVAMYGSWIYNYLCNQCLYLPKVVSFNPAHGKVYLKQHYDKFFTKSLYGLEIFMD
jgi:hypothetical protein